MADEKKKNGNYETEWSFSFENIGSKINEALGSVGDEVKEAHFELAGEGTTALRFIVGGSVGRTTIKPAEDNMLIRAHTVYPGEVNFTVTGEAEKTAKIEAHIQKDIVGSVRRSLGMLGKRQEAFWDIDLGTGTPVNLELNGGVGPTHVDLTGIQLTGLKIDGRVGETNLKLPSTTNPYKVSLDGGVGQVRVDIPADTSATLDIDGGVGQIIINVAAGVAVRLEADAGIGSINTPASFRRVKTDDNMISKGGIWESEGFSLSGRQVSIKYDGGIGNLTIKQDEIETV